MVQALQRSVLQQCHPLLKQLFSVVQPFSPFSVEEETKIQICPTNATEGIIPSQLRCSDRNNATVEAENLKFAAGGLTSGVAGLFDLAVAVQLHVPHHQEVLAVTPDSKIGSWNTNTPLSAFKMI